MKIYTNSYIHSEEINPDNFVSVFEAYADKLEQVAKDYRKLVKTVKTKKIKIVDADGYAHGGHFSVDEIDTARLKKEGIVIDFAEKPCAEDPVFYIDSQLDEVLEETIEKLEQFDPDFEDMAESIMEKILKDEKDDDEDDDVVHFTSADFLDDLEEDDDIEQIDIDFEDLFPEKYTEFNLSEKIKTVDGDAFAPGSMIIEVNRIDDEKFTFNLTMADLGDKPSKVNYMRDKEMFEYQCADCDAIHFESLDSVYRSLKTANALLSNLIEMTKDFRELSTALEFIDADLRLLQWLLRLDYALEDELEDDDEEELL